MPFEIETIPCLADNYMYLLRDKDSGETAIVDVPDHAPAIAALEEKGWSLDHILITHHHWDHIQGVEPLRKATGANVIGNAADAERLPSLDLALNDRDSFSLGAETGVMWDVSGHTIGHVAFYFPNAAAVFTADSLMALGCGRVFEGTFEMMWASLQKFLTLPSETMVYSGHEYTAANAKFALSIDPNNADLVARANDISVMRAKGLATVPTKLSLELATNPFLRAHLPEMKQALGMEHTSDQEVFTTIRSRKDNF